jgi:hypothetical protein
MLSGKRFRYAVRRRDDSPTRWPHRRRLWHVGHTGVASGRSAHRRHLWHVGYTGVASDTAITTVL